jgi:hypothetical protein
VLSKSFKFIVLLWKERKKEKKTLNLIRHSLNDLIETALGVSDLKVEISLALN